MRSNAKYFYPLSLTFSPTHSQVQVVNEGSFKRIFLSKEFLLHVRDRNETDNIKVLNINLVKIRTAIRIRPQDLSVYLATYIRRKS